MKLKLRASSLLLLAFLGHFSSAYASDLLSVYHDAVTDSPLLANYSNTSLAATEDVPVVMGNLFPQVVATAGADINNVRAPTQGVNAGYSNANYGFTITQQVFNYADFANMSVAHYTEQSALANYDAQKQQFILNVAEAYFNVLTAQYDVELALAQYVFLKTTLRDAEAKYRVGVGTYTDVAQARANYDEAYATLIQNKNSLAIANENLRTFTGKGEYNLAMVDGDFEATSPAPQNADYWVRMAEIQNPLLIAQQYTESAALANVHANVGNQLPVVFVQASYQQDYYSNSVPFIISPYTHTLQKSIELGFTWNIFSGGETMSQTIMAADQYVAEQNTSTNLYRQTQSQTTQDYLGVVASVAQIKAYQQSQVSAEATLHEFHAKYRVGSANIVDVLNATQTLYTARYNLSQAMNQYIDNYLSLKHDVGTLSEKDLDDINQHLKVQALGVGISL